MALGQQSRYLSRGFIPLNEPPKTKTIPVAAVTVVRGDALHATAAGVNTYATNAAVLFTAAFLGVAASPIANAAGAAGAANVEYYPFDEDITYIVPVGNALATQAAVGTRVQLVTNAGLVSLAVTVATGICFFIEEIDVSAPALVGNQFGYVLGRFRNTGVQA
jgi:hypothetical protein